MKGLPRLSVIRSRCRRSAAGGVLAAVSVGSRRRQGAVVALRLESSKVRRQLARRLTFSLTHDAAEEQAITKSYVETRAGMETLIEMMQIKGNSEVVPDFWPNDEFAETVRLVYNEQN
ncbi:DUF3604 domain-containing protein [Roseiconus nitratireducens]|uniref:DUF3604 domain-containing protein n=1 Tax=Roseiconus nitratireducens TaxID=2605748 RepID=A0A5M6D4J3_9BACT|nr:DUF3604 domain-containing protein [Roseiconus nitratireducens]KAA5542263.1 DUF3604 domain-containing protein [Roseiconus nitratireducens]